MNQWKGELSWILALILSKSIWKWQNTILTFLIMVAKFLFIVIMLNATFCANSLLQLSSLSDWRELRSALIVKCVFNSCLSYTAIVLNVRTMYPMQKASPLPKNLTTLCQVLLLLKLEFSFICGCYFRRFLGIHLHLRDQELVIGKRVVTVVISIYGCKEQHLLFAILRCYCSLKHQEEFLQKSPNS